MLSVACKVALALVGTSVCLAPVTASRALKQAGTITYPGCIPIEGSVIATNPDFSAFYQLAQATGLIATLQDLAAAGPATLFATTNEAAAEALRAGNVTVEEAAAAPATPGALDYFVVPEALLTLDDFEDGENLPTLLTPTLDENITVTVLTGDSQPQVVLGSFALDAPIVTPPQYACNLVIYGLGASLTTREAVATEGLRNYLSVYIPPGGGEIPPGFIVGEVEAGHTAEVATAFIDAINAGYAQELINLFLESVALPGGSEAFAAIANEAIVLSSCGELAPLIRDLYPALFSSAASLGVSQEELQQIPIAFPALASCAHSL